MTARRLLTDSLLALLRTDTRPVGDGIAPDGAQLPYATLFPLDVDGQDGDYRTLQVTGWHEWQITSVGETREQAEGLADRLRALVVASVLEPTGYRVAPWLVTVEGVLERDDDVKPPVFYVIDVVQGFVTPT